MAEFPANYQNLFDESKNYTKFLFYPGKGLSAAELNELQSAIDSKIVNLADTLLREGDIVSGGSPVVKQDGSVFIPAGAVYVNKGIRKFAEQNFTIPTNTKLKLGVFLTETIIDSTDDSDLLDPSGSIQPGVTYDTSGLETSQRLQETIVWGYVTQAGTRSQATGVFYPSHDVDNGVLILLNTAPVLAEVENLVVNYNNNVNGSYIIDGLKINFDFDDVDDEEYIYTVEPGIASVLGRQTSRSATERVAFTKDPDTQAVNDDPTTLTVGTQTFTATITKGAANGSDALPRPDIIAIQEVKQDNTVYTVTTDYTLSGNNISWSPGGAEPATGSTYTVRFTFTGANIVVDRGPINTVTGVTAQLRVTKTLTRGVVANTADNLPSGFIPAVQIISIPGYTQGVDYQLTGSTVDWSLGGVEPTAGATYNVTYTYNKVIQPDAGSIGYDRFTVTNQGADGDLETGTVCTTNYTYNLKRIDLLELTDKGAIRKVKGRATFENPNQPTESVDALALASIYLDFFNEPIVTNIGNKRVSQKELFKSRAVQTYIIDTLADLQLQVDSIKSGATTKGIFTDNFYDDSKLDLNRTNTLKVFNKLLTLPMTLTKDELDNANNENFQTLNYTTEEIVVQSSYSGAIKINPYATYTPPEPVRLDIKISQEIKDYIDSLLLGAENPNPDAWLPNPDLPPVDPVIDTPKPDPKSTFGINEARAAILAAKGKTELTPRGEAKLQKAFITGAASGSTVVSVVLGNLKSTIDIPAGTVTNSKKKG